MQIDYVRPKLEDQLVYMFSFLEKSFRGLYCSICDSQNHKFVDVKNNTVTISDSYCRESIINVLKPMLYLHDLLHKYTNLVSKFIISCDYKGKFEDRVPSPDHLFHTEYKNRGILNQCNENVNKVDWLESCENVCNQVEITQFNLQFLAPHIKQYMEYNHFLQEKLDEWD